MGGFKGEIVFKKETQRRLTGPPPFKGNLLLICSKLYACEAHCMVRNFCGVQCLQKPSLWSFFCFSKCVTFGIEVHMYQQAESMFLTTGETKKSQPTVAWKCTIVGRFHLQTPDENSPHSTIWHVHVGSPTVVYKINTGYRNHTIVKIYSLPSDSWLWPFVL